MFLDRLSAYQAIDLVKKKQITVSEILQDIIKRIEQVEESIKAFLTLNLKEALQEAKDYDRKINLGEEVPPYVGMMIAVKDNIVTKGIETTCGSKILKGFFPPYNATVIEKLKEAGAIIIGKTNLDEFAMGSSTENSAYQVTRNPWVLSRVPGGSSGGSAAAVVADESQVALGTDTGGSIRQPASFCGIVGLKPTYGRVSRYGLIAFASSLDQIGPLTKNVKDCALLMNIISGSDHRDSTSQDIEVSNYLNYCQEGLKNIKIGIPREYFQEKMDREVKEAFDKSLLIIERMGAELEEISLPHTAYSLPTYYLIANAEASSNLARYDGIQYGYRSQDFHNLFSLYCKTRSEGFGKEVKRRILLGTYALSSGYYDAYYLKAQKVRTLIKEDFDQAFKKIDLLLTPTSPTPAFKLGEKITDPLMMYLSDIFTIPVNLAGLPALSINCGFSQEGLPIGLQIIGPPFGEGKIIKVAYNFEQQNEIEKKKPSIGEIKENKEK